MNKTIKTGHEARTLIKRGLDLVADCVKVTLGPTGRNAILGRHDNTPIITNDGIAIAREVKCDNEIEELGAMIAKEAAALTDTKVGDGTTTTTVILQKIVNTAFNLIDDNNSLIKGKKNSIALKKEITELGELAIKKLEERTKKITKKDIYDVALVSGEFTAIAEALNEIYSEIGTNGYVEVEQGGKEIKYSLYKGLELNVKLYSDYFINDKKSYSGKNPAILVTNGKIDNPLSLQFLIEKLYAEQRDLIIIAPEFTEYSLKMFTATKIKENFNILAVQLPSFGDNRFLKDIALVTEATFIDAKNKTEEEITALYTMESIGRAEKVVIGNTTIIYGGNGDVTARVKEIKQEIEDCSSEFDKLELKRRLSNLSGGFAVLTIGAPSETERTYLKLKADDAVNAVKNALAYGVVRGGGVELKEIAKEMKDTLLYEALCAPHEQIQENSGGISIGKHVYDPVMTLIEAIRSACSLAGTLLTTEVAIASKKDDNKTDTKED